MPGIAAHFALAAEIESLLQFHEDSFVYGCILPDIISSQLPPRPPRYRRGHRPGRKPTYPRHIYVPDPHYHKDGTYCPVPDLPRFWRETELPGYLKLGYAAHLMLDERFLEEFCPRHVDGSTEENLFVGDKIYEDYSRLNPLLVQHFHLRLVRINRILGQEYFYIPIDEKKHRRNALWINNLTIPEPTRYIDFQQFAEFITDTARYIIGDPQFLALAHEMGC